MKDTYMAKEAEVVRDWWVVDASGIPLGRLATFVAQILRGKHKPTFTPHVDVGDHVIVINASKVVLTGRKRDQKFYHSHSGYPGGLRSTPYGELMDKKPTFVVEKAVRGMLPKNKLGRRMIKKLKVYAREDHPHEAQSPQSLEVQL